MLIFRTVEGIQNFLSETRKAGKSIGFAPTMGALHTGHVSLINKAVAENDCCIASIFVNPAQFNDKKDLEQYPRTFDTDLETLITNGNQVLFYPDEKEVYPAGLDLEVKVDFGFLFETMEAVHRPGHFNGVAKAVKRLLDIVQPDNLYMGQKDYQQFLIVKRMIKVLRLEVNLIMCPTVRERDGLAMSSRNMLLSEDGRKAANQISKTLFKAAESLKRETTVATIVAKSVDSLDRNPLLKTEYFEIVDATTLKRVKNINHKGKIAICTSVKAGSVRLIDNILID